MAHAGITPQWDLETAQQCARDVEAVLSSDSYPFFLDAMYGDMPNHWSNELSGLARLRFISNAFTRMRYCFPNGQLDMYSKEAPEDAPAPLKPWFAIPGPVSNAYSIAFGHWASLEGRGTPEGIYALDTGCCWGGELTCLRWEDKQYFHPAVEPPEKPRRRRSRRVLSLPGWRRVAPYPGYIALRFVAPGKNGGRGATFVSGGGSRLTRPTFPCDLSPGQRSRKTKPATGNMTRY